MFKKVIAVLFLAFCFCFTVGAEAQTVFTVNTAQNDKKVMVNVTTDKLSAVAGIDFILSYDPRYFTLKEDTLKCSLNDCIISVAESSIRVLWDTANDERLSEVLLSAEFININSVDASDGFYLTVNEYYESSQLTDLDYMITYASPDSIKTVGNNWFSTLFIVMAIIIGVFIIAATSYLLYINKKIEEKAKKLIKK